MDQSLPLSSASIATIFCHRLALLAGILLWVAPMVAKGQSITFAGAQTTLPFTGLSSPDGIAVDNAGNVFVADHNNNRVVKLPNTSTGFGPQTTLPFGDLVGPYSVAVDNSGDVFVADSGHGQLAALPWTGTGYGTRRIVTFDGRPVGLAVDSMKNLYIADLDNKRVVEVPWTGKGFGPQTTLPFSDLHLLGGVAVDSKGDVFVARNINGAGSVLELPRIGTGYGEQTTLPINGYGFPGGVGVDDKGDVFVDGNSFSGPPSVLVELPSRGTEYEPPVTLPFSGSGNPAGVAIDNTGDVFIDDTLNNRAVEVQTQSVNFGSVNVCAPALCSVTVTLNYNVTATGTLGTPRVLTGGVPDLDFVLANDSTCAGAVTEGTTCVVNVTFAPPVTGVRNGTVEITDSVGNVLATTDISGFGVPPSGPPSPQISTRLLQFGGIPFGTTKILPVTITNIGGGALTVMPSIAGPNFIIAGNTCTAVTTGQTCTLQVELDPLQVGGFSEEMTLQTNGSTNPVIALEGYATLVIVPGTPPTALPSTTYLPFSAVIGSIASMDLSILNIGAEALSVTPSISTHSGRPSPIYTVTSNTCAGVASGGSCSLQVEFSPTSITTYDDLLTLQTNGSANPIVALHGVTTGLSILGGVSGASLRFGSVFAGSTEVLPLTVTNVGLPGTVTIATSIMAGSKTGTSPYTILTTSQNTCLAGIAPGQSCTLPIEFAPTSSGTHDDRLTLTPSAGGGSTYVWLIGSTP